MQTGKQISDPKDFYYFFLKYGIFLIEDPKLYYLK